MFGVDPSQLTYDQWIAAQVVACACAGIGVGKLLVELICPRPKLTRRPWKRP